ncbi:hypothetical protein HNQ80_002836 [Anaerosolibacter carboniphilus]|uniref:Uncharacterized protein n=1 Tax=Anaerosolibacter carboniphilus TaxID=1417629 RepID=A0A841L0N3_9FIRM|nr:hypothetical protein [Anaerosolibacter carboniphilus]MBB6216732.1 hypothetical protein [Anaerosolibacter carboniphilus]
MSARIVSLSIDPREVLELSMGEIDGDLIHSDYCAVDQGRGFGYMVYEYIHKRENRPIMLMIHVDNVHGTTRATILTSPEMEDWEYPFDCEEEYEWMDKIMEVLEEYIIDVREE